MASELCYVSPLTAVICSRQPTTISVFFFLQITVSSSAHSWNLKGKRGIILWPLCTWRNWSCCSFKDPTVLYKFCLLSPHHCKWSSLKKYEPETINRGLYIKGKNPIAPFLWNEWCFCGSCFWTSCYWKMLSEASWNLCSRDLYN